MPFSHSKDSSFIPPSLSSFQNLLPFLDPVFHLTSLLQQTPTYFTILPLSQHFSPHQTDPQDTPTFPAFIPPSLLIIMSSSEPTHDQHTSTDPSSQPTQQELTSATPPTQQQPASSNPSNDPNQAPTPVLQELSGGIPPLQPEGVEFDDLARFALNPDILPPLSNDPVQLENAISHRLRLASIPVDFWSHNPLNMTYQNYHRLGKLRVMIELNEFFGRTKAQFCERLLIDSVNLVIANIFRTFPTKLPEPYSTILPDNSILYCLGLKDHLSPPNDEENAAIQQKYEKLVQLLHKGVPPSDGQLPLVASEDEVQAKDPAWPFIRWVYDFFLRFVVGEIEARTLKKYISAGFILRLLDLFQTMDVREREILKTLLHRIYAKFMTLRAFIRRSLNHVLSIFIYETETLAGVSELLEILGSIINGFAQPLKPEHCVFFHHVLTPMHKVRSLPIYSPQLTYCICQFILKDPSLADSFIRSLIRYWPRTHPTKEALFLEELYEVLERVNSNDLYLLMPKIFQVISPTLASSHSHVCGKALTFITSEFILPYAFNEAEIFTQYVLPSLLTSCNHWNEQVQEQFRITVHQRVTPQHQVYVADLHHALQQHNIKEEKVKAERVVRKQKWDKICASVAKVTAKYDSHAIVFQADQYLPPY